MSSLAGIFSRGANGQRPGQVDRMLSCMAHREPDGRELHVDAGVAMGINYLHATPESVFDALGYSSQPGCRIVADIRLDNRDELISRLGLAGRPAAETSDGQLVVAAYRRWGAGCPERLLGDFAFAIYDLENQSWFCARDQVGAKPFYYHLSGDLFVFASEAKAVALHPGVPAGINQRRVADYLVSAWVYENESTFLEHVKRLPPAHSLRVDARRSALSRYWNLADVPEQRCRHDREYEERFRELFFNAVRARLRSRLPVSTMMSGGLDSSSNTCVAFELAEKEGFPQVAVYSGVSDQGWECRESPYIDALDSHLGIESRRIAADEMAGHAAEYFGLMASLDSPMNTGMLDQRMLTYLLASGSGSNVMLDGLGGDDIFSFPKPPMATMAENGKLWPGLFVSLMMWRSWGGFNREGFGSAWRCFSPAARRWLIPVWMRAIKHRFKPPPPPNLGFRPSLINPRFRQEMGVPERILARASLHRELPESAGALACRLTGEPQLVSAMEMYADMAARFGMEARHPCMDRELIEFCYGLPVRQKVRAGWTKWLLRKSLHGTVPDAVRWRSNIGGVLWRSTYLTMKSNPGLLKRHIEGITHIDFSWLNEAYWAAIQESWFENHDNGALNDIIDVIALDAFLESVSVKSKTAPENLINGQESH